MVGLAVFDLLSKAKGAWQAVGEFVPEDIIQILWDGPFTLEQVRTLGKGRL
jgi:hypothetical protein